MLRSNSTTNFNFETNKFTSHKNLTVYKQNFLVKQNQLNKNLIFCLYCINIPGSNTSWKTFKKHSD